jgi:hypothetical protein
MLVSARLKPEQKTGNDPTFSPEKVEKFMLQPQKEKRLPESNYIKFPV